MDFNKQALVLRIGLGLRRYTRSDISDWVTNQITSREHVEEPLVELGTLVGKTEQDITRLLNQLSGPLPDGMAARIEMAMVARMVETGQLELGTALKHVASLAHEGLTPEERSHVLELDDRYVLALAGTYGTMEQVRSDFEDFTGRFHDLFTFEWKPTE